MVFEAALEGVTPSVSGDEGEAAIEPVGVCPRTVTASAVLSGIFARREAEEHSAETREDARLAPLVRADERPEPVRELQHEVGMGPEAAQLQAFPVHALATRRLGRGILGAPQAHALFPELRNDPCKAPTP